MVDRALVTGGAGFIGSHLTRELVERGVEVRVLDNFSTGSRRNLAPVAAQIELIEGDLRDMEACAAACRDVDVVYHLAALGSVPRSIEDPLTTNAVNVEGTLRLLVAARSAGVRRLVFSSSSSVYGDTPTLPKHEAMCPMPRSPYAVSKLAGEQYCLAYHRTHGLQTVVLRYFNVFGPRQNPDSQYAAAIPRFVSAIQSGRRPVIYGDGTQSRDFTYVSNVVDANLLAGCTPDVEGAAFNVACGERITINEVIESIACHLDSECKPEYVSERPGDVRHSLADISAAWERLGYRPTVPFAEGIERAVRWYTETDNEMRRRVDPPAAVAFTESQAR